MRQALEARGAEGREEKSVVWKWMPGSSFASERVRERGSGEAKEIRIDCMLFAVDTTVVGTKGEMDESVRRVKEVMGRWEERNNEDKEEVLEFGTEEGVNWGRDRLDGGGAFDEWQEGVEGKGGGENGAFGQVGKAEGAWV